MAASRSLYHTIAQHIDRVSPTVPAASRTRLALLVTGLVVAQRCVLARIALELSLLGVCATTRIDSIGRRLRRTLNDPQLVAPAGYADLVPAVLGWTAARPPDQPLVLILDESTHTDQIHLLRLSVAYRGGALPLAWRCWPQNRNIPAHSYWSPVEAVLAEAAAVVPTGVTVVVVADRAYALPGLVDRLQPYGWHWVLRVPTHGQHRWRDAHGTEHALAAVVATHLAAPGDRYRCRGAFGKKAGWRAVQLVGSWEHGYAEPLVVLTDLPPTWAVLRRYGQRFWIEASFRADKQAGWQWEASQVRDPAHQQVLLLALAWATVLALCLGAEAGETQLGEAVAHQRRRPWRVPPPPRYSLCSLGMQALRAWLYHGRDTPVSWRLPDPDGPSWSDHWRATLSAVATSPLPVRP